MNKFSVPLFFTAVTMLGSGSALALDAAAAEKLARKSGCLKCHAPDKDKDGPSMKEIAAKWKVKPDAEDKLFKHATTKPMVKIEGKEEEHSTLKTTDEGEIRNVIRWYLSH
jgi:cytochrome c